MSGTAKRENGDSSYLGGHRGDVGMLLSPKLFPLLLWLSCKPIANCSS